MMRVCLGHDIGAEYATLMREELGFVSRDFAWTRDVAPASRPRVMIVGAGLSGIALGVRLKRLGIEFVIFERHDDVGGVWLENQYPGVGVDTPNHAFSYSFAPPHPWSRYFSPGGEIRGYLREIAQAFGVLPHVRFSCAVTRADWDAQARQWRVALDTPGGARVETAPVLVTAIGQFGEPQTPRIAGAGDFSGRLFHSARWPKDYQAGGTPHRRDWRGRVRNADRADTCRCRRTAIRLSAHAAMGAAGGAIPRRDQRRRAVVDAQRPALCGLVSLHDVVALRRRTAAATAPRPRLAAQGAIRQSSQRPASRRDDRLHPHGACAGGPI